VILIDFINIIERFWSFLGDIGPFLRPNLGGKLGDGYQLQIYINQGFLKPKRRFREGLWWIFSKPKPFLWREAVEESTFAGHFWELRSSDLSVVSFLGF
jgi:hypothetical protein